MVENSKQSIQMGQIAVWPLAHGFRARVCGTLRVPVWVADDDRDGEWWELMLLFALAARSISLVFCSQLTVACGHFAVVYRRVCG